MAFVAAATIVPLSMVLDPCPCPCPSVPFLDAVQLWINWLLYRWFSPVGIGQQSGGTTADLFHLCDLFHSHLFVAMGAGVVGDVYTKTSTEPLADKRVRAMGFHTNTTVAPTLL